MKRFLIVAAACFLLAAPCFAQTGTTVTGTTKTADEKTPVQAGLKVLKRIGSPTTGTDVYGTIEVRACEVDSQMRCVKDRESQFGTNQYLGKSLGYIKGDGTWIAPDETAGIKRVPNAGGSPAGLATEFKITLQPSVAEPTRLPKTEIFLVRTVPDQASVDFSSLTVPVAATPAAGKQDQSQGSMFDFEKWTRYAAASVPSAAAGSDNVFIDLADEKLKARNSAGALRELGGAGGSTVISIDAVNLTTQSPLNFQDTTEIDWTNPSAGNVQIALKAASVADSKLATISTTDKVSPGAINDGGAAATQALFSGAAGAAAFRAIADADVPDNIAITVNGTTEEITVTGTTPPVVSIPAVLNLAAKTLKGGSPLVFEGLTVDAFETTLVVTDPTAARTFTLPNANSAAVQPLTCGGTDKVSAVSTLGVISCTTDQNSGGTVTSVSGTAEEISSTGGATPVISLPTVINLSGKTLKGGSPLVFEGLTADTFEITLVVTDPTVARLFTLPNADSVAIQPLTCGGTDKVSAVSALGVVTCTADAGGAGSGDNITVNTVAAVDADFDDATPAAPANAGNVKWQKDALTPNNISAHILWSTLAAATFGAGSGFAWTFDAGATDPVLTLGSGVFNVSTGTLQQGGTAVVLTTRTLTGGAGIAALGDLSADRTIATASGETDFLASGALVCGAATQGKMQVHTTPLQYCDNAATPALQYAAYGDASGNALGGDTATAFFGAGTLEDARLSVNVVLETSANTYGAFAQDFEGASVTRPFRRLAFASFPATCTANREFLERSDPATAGQVIYVCNAAGTGWDLVGDGGGAGGDSISVNGTAATDADFDDATPAAPSNKYNVKWQKDALTPNNLSAYVDPALFVNPTWGAGATLTWTFDAGATDPVWTIGSNSMDLSTGVLKVGGTAVPALVAVGTNGTAAVNAGDDTTGARSDHEHNTFLQLAWYFPGTPSAAVQTAVGVFPEGLAGIAITDMRITVNTTSASTSSVNIQRCTASCTGTGPTFAAIYSADLSLAANTRTVAKASAPNQNVSSLVGGDQFKVQLVTVGASLADVTVTMTYKVKNTN